MGLTILGNENNGHLINRLTYTNLDSTQRINLSYQLNLARAKYSLNEHAIPVKTLDEINKYINQNGSMGFIAVEGTSVQDNVPVAGNIIVGQINKVIENPGSFIVKAVDGSNLEKYALSTEVYTGKGNIKWPLPMIAKIKDNNEMGFLNENLELHNIFLTKENPYGIVKLIEQKS